MTNQAKKLHFGSAQLLQTAGTMVVWMEFIQTIHTTMVSGVWCNMGDGKALSNVNLSNPGVVKQSIMNSDILLLGETGDGRSYIFWFRPIKPERMPKFRCVPVPDGNGGGRLEQVHIDTVAGVAKAHPSPGRLLPRKPRPSQAQSTSIFAEIEAAQAAQPLRPTNQIPNEFALPARDLTGA